MQAASPEAIHHIARGGLPTLTELLAADHPRVALGLIGIGAVVWLAAYVLAIRTGFREKTYAIPLLAVCLNITWELTHSLVFRPATPADLYNHLAWLVLDLIILAQVFRYGRRMQRIEPVRRHFPLVVATTLILSLAGHVSFHRFVTANSIFPDQNGAVAAYIINLVMSVLFVAMYCGRPDGTGLSRGVAWTKFIGTGLYSIGNVMVLLRIPEVRYEVQVRKVGEAAWVAAGQVGNNTIHPGFMFFLIAGTTIFDLLYLWLLYRKPRSTTA